MALGSLVVRITSIAAAAALLFSVWAMVGPEAAVAQGPCAATATAFDVEEQAFVAALNDYRADRGLAPLIPTITLRRSALWHAGDMAQRDYFAHNDSIGRDPSTRAMDCGYPTYVAQNIAAGTVRDTGVAALELFLSSPPHVVTLSDPNARYIGVARAFSAASKYSWYWVSDFGAVADPAGAMPTRAAPEAEAATGSPVAPLRLTSGWNLVTWTGAELSVAELFSSTLVRAVYTYEPSSGVWGHASEGAPAYVNTIRALVPGAVYWLVMD